MNGGRRVVAPALWDIAWTLGTVAVYVTSFGASAGNWAIAALGIALLVLAVALLLVRVTVSALRGDPRGRQPDHMVVPATDPSISEEELADLPVTPPPWVLPLEDEPSGLVARYLFPTERFRGEWRRHLVRPIRAHVATLAIAILGIIAVRQRVRPEYVAEAVAAICSVGALAAIHANLAWSLGRFALTNKRVMLVEGVLRRRVSSMPLLQISDLRFEQSLSGRAVNYGCFVIEDARWRSRMRRIADLPNPHELYLRIVEEMYEPQAVEARLGHGHDDELSPDPTATETLSLAIREALYGPALTNYDGWVSIEILDDGRHVPVSEDRRVRLEPGRSYELYVVVASDPTTGTAEPLVVTDGVDRDVVEFAAEVDSDQRVLRRPRQSITVDGDRGVARFAIQTPDEDFAAPPWLWIRVSQHRRLLQSVELVATGRAALER